MLPFGRELKVAAGMGLVPWSLNRRARMDVVDKCAMGAGSIDTSECSENAGLD